MHPDFRDFFVEDSITDVAFNSHSNLAIKSRGMWSALASPFADDDQFSDWVIDLVEAAGGRIDFQNPAASVAIDDFRIHAVLAAGVSDCTRVTFRKLGSGSAGATFYDAISNLHYERLAHEMSRGVSVLIAGAAGSGKTTLLRALLTRFSSERIITIEDTPELKLQSSNAVALYARPSNVEGFGNIDLGRLVFEALRMSPDRIAVGEVRGAEILVLLDALNTGHGGAGATIHANSLEAVASRLLTIASMAGISETALAGQVVAAFGAVAFVENDGGYRISALGRFELSAHGLRVVQFSD